MPPEWTLDDDAVSGSWLASRLGIDPRRVDAMRRGGELLAARHADSQEWHYPAWQFGRGFEVLAGLDRVIAAARESGMGDRQLAAFLSQRAGLVEGRPLGELLREGGVDHVVAAVRASKPGANPRS